jgi:hypothetical protein
MDFIIKVLGSERSIISVKLFKGLTQVNEQIVN